MRARGVGGTADFFEASQLPRSESLCRAHSGHYRHYKALLENENEIFAEQNKIGETSAEQSPDMSSSTT